MTFAFWIISALVIKSFISELNNFLTSIVSAPDFFKYDAASNVLTPVLNAKFLVSKLIPASNPSAVNLFILTSSSIYCTSSVTISHVDDT